MKRNLILLIVCALIAAYFYWDTERIKEKEEQEEKEKELISLTQDEIKEVTVVNKEGTFKAVKEDDRWKLVEPFNTDGDNTAWNGIVRNIADGKKQRVVNENPETFEPFGLAEPSQQVTVSGIGGATATTLLLGNKTPTSGKYYARIKDSSEVVTVWSSLYTSADKKLYDLRDKTILKLTNEDVQRIEIKHPGLKTTIERKGESEWNITDPVLVRADESKIRDLINGVKNGEIKQFVDENPDNLASYGLIEPVTSIVFWTSETGDQSSMAARGILLGASDENENVFAKHQGQNNVFAVDPEDFKNMPQDINSLRMTKITPLRSWDVKELKIASVAGTILEATKAPGDWYIYPDEEGGELKKADYSGFSDLVRKIVDLEIADYIDSGTEGIDIGDPYLSVELKTDDMTETIELSAPQSINGATYCLGMKQDPLEVYGVDSSTVDEIRLLARSKKEEAMREEPTPTPAPVEEE